MEINESPELKKLRQDTTAKVAIATLAVVTANQKRKVISTSFCKKTPPERIIARAEKAKSTKQLKKTGKYKITLIKIHGYR